MGKIITIAKNAVVETVRQPVFVIILAGGALLIGLSPSFATFSLMNDIKLVKDMGLATILLTGLLQGTFCAAHVVSSEVENKTVLLVLSKPVSKAQFVLGKYLGVAAALAASTYLLTLVLLLTIRVGVPEAAWVKLHRPVISGEIFALSAAVVIALLANYFHDRSFCSSCFGYSLLSFTFVFILLGFVNSDLGFQKFCADVDVQVINASYLILLAVLTVAAVAIALSTRFSLVLSVVLCVCIFTLGLLSDHIFGSRTENLLLSGLARIGYALVPNMQVFWVADAVVAGETIPGRYLFGATGYGVLYQMAMLTAAVVLFETREIA
jgi:hypothetical protein